MLTRRRLPLLLVLLLAASPLVAPRAEAHEDSCVAYGLMATSAGFGAALTADPTTADFAWSVSFGVCASWSAVSATGTITGWCQLAWGTGTTDKGHTFDFVSAGTRVYYTGEMAGAGHMFPDPLAPGSCANGTVGYFITSVEVVLAHGVPRRCDVTGTLCGTTL